MFTVRIRNLHLLHFYYFLIIYRNLDLSKFETAVFNSCVKGTVIPFSSDPPCKDGNGRFTTVPLKAVLIKQELDLLVFVSLNYFFICGFILKLTCALLVSKK